MADAQPSFRVLFVCLGNICRSPTAEGVMKHLVDRAQAASRFHLDSAGTDSYHTGEEPDPRTRAAAKARGIQLQHRARTFEPGDLERFDLILAMDGRNEKTLLSFARTSAHRAKIRRLRSYERGSDGSLADGGDVPDPYYGGAEGFERVLDICERSCAALLAELLAAR